MASVKLMKGHTFREGRHRLQYPVFVEAKVDEVRCHIRRWGGTVVFESYAGGKLHNLEPWAQPLDKLLRQVAMDELDAGVLVNDNYGDTYRWVRSSLGAPADLYPSQVRFLLFDLPALAVQPYHARRDVIKRVVETGWTCGVPFLSPLPSELAPDEAAVHAVYDKLRDMGYEGAMVKTLGHQYVRARSWEWLKLKPTETADGKITAINRAYSIHGDPLDRAASVTVQTEDGATAQPAAIPHDLGRQMFAYPDEYLGQWVEFKYMERDRRGGYRHPSFVRLREAK